MDKIAQCPTTLPHNISDLVYKLGGMWAESEGYPSIEAAICKTWQNLIHKWIENRSLPLFVRKSSLVRGSQVMHTQTGRKIIPCDNSPAQWACHLALKGITPTIEDLEDGFARDKIPVAFAHKKIEESERAYHCTLGKFTVNKAGWKLCHIDAVGLRSRKPIADLDIDILEKAFKKLIDPTNFFLIPKQWAGLGETEEFIKGVIQNRN